MRWRRVSEAVVESVYGEPDRTWLDSEGRNREKVIEIGGTERRVKVVTALDDDNFVKTVIVRREAKGT